jgi:hypothetical protein
MVRVGIRGEGRLPAHVALIYALPLDLSCIEVHQLAHLRASQAELERQVAQRAISLIRSLSLSSWVSRSKHYPIEEVSYVSGKCHRCGWGAGLFERRVETPCAAVVSHICPACGSDNPVLDELRSVALAFVQIRVLETLVQSIILLRLVMAAVSVLLSRLRKSASHYAIVVNQKSFFMHHGAHPPRIQPIRALGLSPEKAFQLQIAR